MNNINQRHKLIVSITVKQLDSMLLCVSSVIGHTRCQNVVRTKKRH